MKRTTVSERALVLAPRGRDASIASDMLREAGVEAVACAALPDLVAELDHGAGFAVVAEEALATADLGPLATWIDGQEDWSDLPFVLLTNRGGGLERNPAARRYLETLGNVTFLERPFHPTTLVSVATASLRGRRRQYEARARLAALHDGEARLRLAVENAEVGFWDVDVINDVLIWPAATKAMFGISADAPVSMADFYNGLHPDDREATGAAYAAAADPARRALYDVEYRTIGKEDGVVRWVAAKGRGVFDADGRCLRVAGTAIDITTRKAVEAALDESETRYRTLFDTIDEGFCVIRFIDGPHGPLSDYVHVQANAAYTLNAGIPDIVGKRLRDIVGEEADAWVATFGGVLATGEAVRFEQELVATGRHLELAAFRVDPASRREVAVIFKDVTARRRAEAALRELNETLEQRVAERTAERDRLWELSPDLMTVVDFEGRLLRVNPSWTRVLGYDEDRLLTRPYAEILHPDELEPIGALLDDMQASGLPSRLENRMLAADGSWRHFVWTLSPEPDGERLYSIGRDVTEEKARRAELDAANEALLQSQKLETLGQLTGGVAHDFNNLLTPITGALDLIGRRYKDDARSTRLIEGALQSAERAKILVQRLLGFARRQTLETRAIDLAELLESMRDLVASSVGAGVDLRFVLPDDLPPALVDPNQLELAVLNLCVNARDAMPTGGALTVALEQALVGPRAVRSLAPGAYLRLSVIDTGVGMDEATLARAVEPFYSTKELGKGTGLGLSMVHGFAAQLGGAFVLTSVVAQGTRADLYLPVAAAEASENPRRADAAQAPPARLLSILLVDDEDLVRAGTAEMLRELGHTVAEARGGAQALGMLAAGLSVDVLVTDYMMPRMDGAELARRVRETYPAVAVLVITGYAGGDLDVGLPHLAKPFRQSGLQAALDRVVAPADNVVRMPRQKG